MENKPLIDVIIPVYNCEKYLAAAINSVIEQSYKPNRIIVVDDGSSDRSAEVARSFENLVQYNYIENSGAAAAVNHGINLSKGDLIGFLDADDLWEPNKLALQVAAFEQDIELEAVFGHIRQFKSPELSQKSKSQLKITAEIIPAYHRDTLLVTKSTFEKVGLFNPEIKMGEFIDWYLRASEQGLKSMMLPNILAQRRLHKNNMGIIARQSRQEYARIIKASLDRRRRLGTISSP